jgi:hypothetical protein
MVIGFEKVRQGRTFSGALFNATHIRLFLDRLLPSRAYLRFTGHLQNRRARPEIVPPEIFVSTLFIRL